VKIYGVPPSTFVRAVRLTCHEKGVAYELVTGAPGAAHLPAHPFGKIPIFQHKDTLLFESSAICRYIDRVFPGPALQPADALGAARCDMWISFVCDYFYKSHSLGVFLPRFGLRKLPEAEIQANLLTMRAHMAVADKQLAATPYLAGEQMTLADLFLAPIIFYVPEVPEAEKIAKDMPNLVRWAKSMGGRASIKATDPQFPPKTKAASARPAWGRSLR